MIKIFFFFLLFSSQIQAGPSRYSCEFYQEVETEFSCGPKGYLKKFGIPLCRKYLAAEPTLSPRLRNWLQDVRLCLQVELERELGMITNCGELRSAALDSHVGCYKSTGFCELPFKDKFKVVQLTSSRILSREVLGLARKLPMICPAYSFRSDEIF